MTTSITYPSCIRKADQRAVRRTAGSQTFRTQFPQPVRVDDLFLAPGATRQFDPAELPEPLLLVPVVGGALLTLDGNPEQALLPGFVYLLPAAATVHLSNPFDHETVNVLLIRAALPVPAPADVLELELPLTTRNVLVAPADYALPVRVGLFDSRVKGRVAGREAGTASLCYVLNGAFEVEDRLLEHRDALLLWDTPALEFEALAETAMLLYLEVNLAP